MTPDQLRDAENGIWLCAVCATEIDKDETRFPVYLLRQWKLAAEAEAVALLASPATRHLGIPAAPFRPPRDYQRSALTQVFDHLRRSGVVRVPVAKLASLLPDLRLRDGTNPIFEPLLLEHTVDALNESIDSGTVQIIDHDIVLP